MVRDTQRFAGIDDKQIIVHFHGLRKRRGHLPESPRIMTTQHKYFSNLLFETIGILVQDRYIDMQFVTGYTCNYTLIFLARERIIQAGTDHVCSPCTPCCILCFLVLASFSVYNLNYFGSLAGFQSACSFTFSGYVDFWSASAFVFFKLNVCPW